MVVDAGGSAMLGLTARRAGEGQLYADGAGFGIWKLDLTDPATPA